MSSYVFHYTSRELAQAIRISGWLSPGRGGKLYLTDDAYEQGNRAARRLAIIRKPIEMVLAIPEAATRDVTEPRPVEPILAPDGSEIRSGGGTERTTRYALRVRGVATWSLGSP